MPTTITILAAVYGTPTAGFDVTNGCGGGTSIAVNDTTFPDPAPNVPKFFGVLYSVNNGNPIALGCPENTTLVLLPTTATTSLQPPLNPAGSVKVVHAVYGTSTNGNDVTAICQALVNQGNSTIPVNNAVLGPDPSVGSLKYFCIIYTTGSGAHRALACPENTNLLLDLN